MYATVYSSNGLLAPEDTVKLSAENDAIPLLVVVASSPATVTVPPEYEP